MGTGARVKPRAPLPRRLRYARPSIAKSGRCLDRTREVLVERAHPKQALAQVRANKGAAGIESMSFEALGPT
jgi:hypothetical protein